ncbi:MAG TPA: tRNA (guanosine(37)-N1)-methyltransferase TrmD, partial [Candidatus Nanoarchaeia archaeon]
MIQFDILTLFPDFFKTPLSSSLTAKAISKEILAVEVHDIRKFGKGKRRQVDDRPFGGGPGMVLKPDCLADSLKQVAAQGQKKLKEAKPHVIFLDPGGRAFNQERAQGLARKRWIILICGHYEGVDERFKELFVDEEISIGDYILSGGETAALVLVDTIARLIPGFLGKSDSAVFESFSKAKLDGKKVLLLDYPVYTRPE